jgi:hypothetical protein
VPWRQGVEEGGNLPNPASDPFSAWAGSSYQGGVPGPPSFGGPSSGEEPYLTRTMGFIPGPTRGSG